jgi:protein Tex
MTALHEDSLVALVAHELGLAQASVAATAKLLAEGATIPFMARYRKEVTGNLDEVQLRAIEERLAYVRELEERRASVIAEIEKQGKLTPELKTKLEKASTKADLEDLYLPYKPKRRTKAMIARERGLEPLALLILAQGAELDPEKAAAAYVNAEKEVPDVAAALAGARDIVAETIVERADVRALVRESMQKEGVLTVSVVEEKASERTKFEAVYGLAEKISAMPSHRYLAVRRGEAEGVLRAELEVDRANLAVAIEPKAGLKRSSPFAPVLRKAIDDGLRRSLVPSLESDLRVDKKLEADREAVTVFAENLRRLLLAAPLGRCTVLGIDPGQRTGCKCAMVDDTGRLVAHDLFNLVGSEAQTQRAREILTKLVLANDPKAIAVGNGTHGRETEAFVREVLKAIGSKALVVMVSEAGASVYSASDVAREEFPDLDLTVRGAISIARRLQDPLAELVKIDPKAIGVGQYQHDVHQPLLKRKLEEVIESCVNAVGVELNTASAPLLAHVAGVGETLAKRIVSYRNEHGAFGSRAALRDVPGVGPKTFEQCAGFLRIHGGRHPLDASAVHPERYPLVERIAVDLGVAVDQLVGNEGLLKRVAWEKYVTAEVGRLTLEDIRAELLKPGRDPRATFEAPQFRDDVRTMTDLAAGMELEGVVTNVTAFGAFVDVGVHQDGLVHVSQLADRFVKDPHEVVKVGDRVKVRVTEVDLQRKRIGLTMRRDGGATQARGGTAATSGPARGPGASGAPSARGGAPRREGSSSPTSSGGGFANRAFEGLLRK